ncbi:MAG: tyrosine-type recombinase/integrase [Bacteroidales bacterium]|nr:tyrosine-type recombinase/integrase [Bacteroidales bacterium]
MTHGHNLTIIEKAIYSVKGFAKVYHLLKEQIVLNNQSYSTLSNYLRQIALVCLYFMKLPEEIDTNEINRYLVELALKPGAPSRSFFKHTVYGLRYYYRCVGMEDRAVGLPSLKHDFKLPVILNRAELRELFKAPASLKHRVVLTLIYSAGLRCREVINLKLADVDFERKTIHIHRSKYKKDRIVPLSPYMMKGLKKYIDADKPKVWLFNGIVPESQYSVKGLSWIIRNAYAKTSIQKPVSLHTLRHSYATHLLEEGVNIVSIKNLLGHSSIATTMVYLHVAQCPVEGVHSPLNTLYPQLRQWG